jgi:hypothetical protein
MHEINYMSLLIFVDYAGQYLRNTQCVTHHNKCIVCCTKLGMSNAHEETM